MADTGAPDQDYALVQGQFSEAEQVQLTMLIGMINLWNRLAVGLRSQHPAERDLGAASRVAA